MELLGKIKRGKPKRRFLDVVKEDMGKVGTREKEIESRMFWINIICCGYPRSKGKAKRRKLLFTNKKNPQFLTIKTMLRMVKLINKQVPTGLFCPS